MKKLFFFVFQSFILLTHHQLQAQNVGIGTTTPNATALLHVDVGGSVTNGVLISGTQDVTSTFPNLGLGSRLMYYPGKAAFRAGFVSGTQWDNANVGSYSIATGSNTIANGIFSVAMGSYNIASGSNAMATGYFTTASGSYSTSMGLNTIAGGENSTATGNQTHARGYSSTVVGMFNDPILSSDQILVSATTPLFIVGNGDNNTIRSNALVVRKDGNVGIGTNIPSQKLQVNGNICYTGSIAACSDIRYKKNIQPLTNALSSVLSLHGIYYNWNKEKFSDKGFTDDRQLGFSAQEIEKLYPEIVQTDANGYKAVDYSRLTPVLVEAVKEQQKIIEQQQKDIDLLKMQMQKLLSKN